MHHPRASALILASACLAVAATAPARAGGGLPDARLGVRTAPLLLLSRADVRADLKLTPEQAAASERAIADLHERAQALKGRDDAEAAAGRATVERASAAWLEENLSASQLVRLSQLDLQWEGPSAMLSRPRVSESLDLTDAQRQSLARAIAARNTRRASGSPDPGAEAALEKEARSTLSEAQQTQWDALLGPPCAFRTAAATGATGTASR